MKNTHLQFLWCNKHNKPSPKWQLPYMGSSSLAFLSPSFSSVIFTKKFPQYLAPKSPHLLARCPRVMLPGFPKVSNKALFFELLSQLSILIQCWRNSKKWMQETILFLVLLSPHPDLPPPVLDRCPLLCSPSTALCPVHQSTYSGDKCLALSLSLTTVEEVGMQGALELVSRE